MNWNIKISTILIMTLVLNYNGISRVTLVKTIYFEGFPLINYTFLKYFSVKKISRKLVIR